MSRRTRAQAHARHPHHCTCGKIVWGNGGRANHGHMHERRDDGHHFVSPRRFYELWPNAPGAPLLPGGETIEQYQARVERP